MNLSFDRESVLIVSPHADDWFLGCLAVMHRAEKGMIYILSGSGWENEQEQVDEETEEALTRASPKGWIHGHASFSARRLEENRKEILDGIFYEITTFKPGTLLLPGGRHQDHETCLREGYRAALNSRDVSILYYFPSLNDPYIYGQRVNAEVTLMLGDEVAKMKAAVFEDVWKTQHHRREYCQLGDRELYALGRHMQ